MTDAHTAAAVMAGAAMSGGFSKPWVTWIAAVGAAAGIIAAGLLWMVLTRPIALAQLMSALQ